jgi:hypothetical protein
MCGFFMAMLKEPEGINGCIMIFPTAPYNWGIVFVVGVHVRHEVGATSFFSTFSSLGQTSSSQINGSTYREAWTGSAGFKLP